MSERFYLNSAINPGPVELEGEEARHLSVVCRLRPGDTVCLFNGDGREYPARIEDVGKKQVRLEVLGSESPARELAFPLEVAAPLPRGDRAQFLVEKLTELGVTRFVPLATRRSVVQPREAKLEKLHRHVIEASKQCGRNTLMKVESLCAWEEYSRGGNSGELKIIAHLSTAPAARRIGRDSFVPQEAGVRLAVGPEGGFTEDEIARASAHGWQTIDLGPRTLRVETAALVLAATFGTRMIHDRGCPLS